MLLGLHHAANVPVLGRTLSPQKLVGPFESDGECWCGVHGRRQVRTLQPKWQAVLSPILSPSVCRDGGGECRKDYISNLEGSQVSLSGV